MFFGISEKRLLPSFILEENREKRHIQFHTMLSYTVSYILLWKRTSKLLQVESFALVIKYKLLRHYASQQNQNILLGNIFDDPKENRTKMSIIIQLYEGVLCKMQEKV